MDQTRFDKLGLGQSLGQMVDEAESLLKRVGDAGGREYDSALKKAAEKLRSAKTDFLRVEEVALQRAREAARATDDVVHEHPYASIGIAAALGVLIGVLFSRR